MLHSKIRINGDPDSVLEFGVGFVGDEAMKPYMSPERWEAEQAAMAKEQKDAADALEQERLEAEGMEAFWAAQRGAPPKRTPADVLREVADKMDRADRKEMARQGLDHRPDCGCETCGARWLGTGITEPPPKAKLTMLRESQANLAVMNAKPATAGDVKPVAAEAKVANLKVDRLAAAFDRFLGRR